MKHGCDELGLCQVAAARAIGLPGRRPCARCSHPFAPGAIQAFQRRRTMLQRAARGGVVLLVLSAVAGLLAGYARGKGWL